MSEFSKDQLADIQDVFNVLDNRGDGRIEQNQVGDCLRGLGLNPTEAQVKKFTSQMLPGERVTMDVFLPIYQTVQNQKVSEPDELIDGLRFLDADASGFLPATELRRVLTQLGERLTEEQVDELLSGQEDSQGNVNYESFIRMLVNG